MPPIVRIPTSPLQNKRLQKQKQRIEKERQAMREELGRFDMKRFSDEIVRSTSRDVEAEDKEPPR